MNYFLSKKPQKLPPSQNLKKLKSCLKKKGVVKVKYTNINQKKKKVLFPPTLDALEHVKIIPNKSWIEDDNYKNEKNRQKLLNKNKKLIYLCPVIEYDGCIINGFVCHFDENNGKVYFLSCSHLINDRLKTSRYSNIKLEDSDIEDDGDSSNDEKVNEVGNVEVKNEKKIEKESTLKEKKVNKDESLVTKDSGKDDVEKICVSFYGEWNEDDKGKELNDEKGNVKDNLEGGFGTSPNSSFSNAQSSDRFLDIEDKFNVLGLVELSEKEWELKKENLKWKKYKYEENEFLVDLAKDLRGIINKDTDTDTDTDIKPDYDTGLLTKEVKIHWKKDISIPLVDYKDSMNTITYSVEEARFWRSKNLDVLIIEVDISKNTNDDSKNTNDININKNTNDDGDIEVVGISKNAKANTNENLTKVFENIKKNWKNVEMCVGGMKKEEKGSVYSRSGNWKNDAGCYGDVGYFLDHLRNVDDLNSFTKYFKVAKVLKQYYDYTLNISFHLGFITNSFDDKSDANDANKLMKKFSGRMQEKLENLYGKKLKFCNTKEIKEKFSDWKKQFDAFTTVLKKLEDKKFLKKIEKREQSIGLVLKNYQYIDPNDNDFYGHEVVKNICARLNTVFSFECQSLLKLDCSITVHDEISSEIDVCISRGYSGSLIGTEKQEDKEKIISVGIVKGCRMNEPKQAVNIAVDFRTKKFQKFWKFFKDIISKKKEKGHEKDMKKKE